MKLSKTRKFLLVLSVINLMGGLAVGLYNVFSGGYGLALLIQLWYFSFFVSGAHISSEFIFG